jgi:replication factor C large subunit
MHIPWTAKYVPKATSEVQGQAAVLQQLQQFVKTRKPGTVCLLYGPTGVGKTSMVQALAKEFDAELLEVNASDERNESSIMEVLAPALKQQSLFFKSKIILFDEVDGLSGNSDRGGISAILKLAKETPFPIIMTANDIWQQKFADLRKQSVMVQARTLSYTSIVPILKRIALAEKITYEEEALKIIARRAGGDARAAITDLQTLGSPITLQSVDTLSDRNITDSILNAVRIVLKTKDPVTARKAFETIQEDVDEIFLWMDENMPKEYRRPEDLARAYQALATADVFRGRIRKWQHWRFLVYCYDLLGPGISVAKQDKYDGFTQMGATQRIFTIWRSKSAKRDAVVEKLAKQQHTSKRCARAELRILKKALIEAPFLTEEEREWLAG